MNRDEGQYLLSYVFDEILIEKRIYQIDGSTDNTKTSPEDS